MNRPPKQSVAITANDLSDFLNDESSFAFEMSVREMFVSRQLRCSHGGTYADPHTGLPREFDLQVELNCQGAYLPVRVCLAIECKSLSEFAPMLVCRSLRNAYEAGHHLIATTCGKREPIRAQLQKEDVSLHGFKASVNFPEAITLDLQPSRCRYSSGEYVGKSIDCVYRDGSGRLKGSDGEIYNRWTQALQSASSMLPRITENFYFNDDPGYLIHLVIPILVVPNDRLYVADFDDSGSRIAGPINAARTSFYVDYDVNTIQIGGRPFRFRHLEIMTLDHLHQFVADLGGDEMRLHVESLLPINSCLSELAKF